MTKYRLYVVLALGLLVIAAIWLWLRPEAPVSTPIAQQEQSPSLTPRVPANAQPTPIFTSKPSEDVLQQKIAEGERAKQEQEKAFSMAFNTPINFWGKVIDENGKPVPGALVKLGTADRPWETGSSYERTTDGSGLFSITGVKGLSISVDVSKDGYYQTSRSRGQISYAQPSGNKEPMPTSDNPTVFELRTMGKTVPLIRVTDRAVRVPKDGAPVEVNLATGQTVPSGQGGLKVECWTDDQNKDAQGQYTWRCRLSVPGGGLLERTDQYAFEAPADGYKSSVELVPSPEKWSDHAEQEYFVKLTDARYARINFRVRTGGEHFFVIESYLNPTSDDRNLEFNPAKAVKSP